MLADSQRLDCEGWDHESEDTKYIPFEKLKPEARVRDSSKYANLTQGAHGFGRVGASGSRLPCAESLDILGQSAWCR